eukprot:COSAG04_NODE_1947_length_5165_cov_4.526077_1_plen_84_part_10
MPQVVARPNGPTHVADALLDVSRPFDDGLLERLNGWMAGTSGTPYDPPPPPGAPLAEASVLSSSIWPSASFEPPPSAASQLLQA